MEVSALLRIQRSDLNLLVAHWALLGGLKPLVDAGVVVLVRATKFFVALATLEPVHANATLVAGSAALHPREAFYFTNLERSESLGDFSGPFAQLKQLFIGH